MSDAEVPVVYLQYCYALQVSWWSVLWLILFLLYMADLLWLENIGLHLNADDRQIYGFFSLYDTLAFAHGMASCINNVSAWVKSNHLQLNAKWILCGVFHVDNRIGFHSINIYAMPVSCVHDLGVYINHTHQWRFASQRLCLVASAHCSIWQSVRKPVFFTCDIASVDMIRLWTFQSRCYIWSTPWSSAVSAQHTLCDNRKYDHYFPLLPRPLAVSSRLYHLSYLSRDRHWAADSDSWRRVEHHW